MDEGRDVRFVDQITHDVSSRPCRRSRRVEALLDVADLVEERGVGVVRVFAQALDIAVALVGITEMTMYIRIVEPTRASMKRFRRCQLGAPSARRKPPKMPRSARPDVCKACER